MTRIGLFSSIATNMTAAKMGNANTHRSDKFVKLSMQSITKIVPKNAVKLSIFL